MAEWRKVETEVTDGPGQVRTETSYVFGAEYDGVFVPALTKSAGYFEHLLERGQQDAQRQQDAQAGQTSTSDTSGTSTTQTPQQTGSRAGSDAGTGTGV